jgi:LacI family transcriptional regulator
MSERSTKITMSDVARESGLSLSTVSLALNDKPGLPPETRIKVRTIAQLLGYKVRSQQPVPHRRCPLKVVSLLVRRDMSDYAAYASNIIYANIIAGIESGCREENISLLYSTLSADCEGETTPLIPPGRVDALLLVGNTVDKRLNAALIERGKPVVLVEAPSTCGEYDSVMVDYVGGAYKAVSHLIELGHRHIAFLDGSALVRAGCASRRQGYLQALNDRGISTPYLADCQRGDRAGVISAVKELLTNNPQVTGIFACSAEVSVLAVHAVLETGRSIPNDISLVGFDNSLAAETALPPLTSVHVDHFGMGRLAVQMLINRAEHPDQGYTTTHMLTRLVERKSVANPG